MGFRRVSEAEMHGRGNLGRPDTPGVSTTEMQRIMDELPREVLAPAFNELAGQLEAATAAGQLGAALPGEELPGETPQTVQGVLNALLAYVQAHEQRTDDPHRVTAAQTGAYTKAETDERIGRRVVEIGSADMAQAVYDPTGRQEDVFAAIDAAAGLLAEEDRQLREAGAALADGVRVFACILPADGWTLEDGGEDGGAGGGTGDGPAVYTQTAACPGLLAAYDLEAPQVPVVGVRQTDAALKEGLDALCEAGNSGETLDGALRWTCYGSHPEVDLPLRLRRAAADAGEDEDAPPTPGGGSGDDGEGEGQQPGGGQESGPSAPGGEEAADG